MEGLFSFLVGIDWATQAHQVHLMDQEGRTLEELVVDHTGAALSQFAQHLMGLCQGDPGRVAVAIETPRGAVVEMLVERGFAVFAVNPKQLDRFRDRYTVAGAKDDRRDAFVLADSLRTDQHCFRRVRLDDPLIIQIREFSRVDEDLCQEEGRLSNRLRDLLHRFFPQMVEFSSPPDDAWLWELLEYAPTPQRASLLRRQTVEKLLRKHRIRRLTAEEVLSKLKVSPLPVAPGVVEACAAHMALLLPRLRLVHQQRQRSEKHLEQLLGRVGAEETAEADESEHRDIEILRSLPGVGRLVAATMLAEASQPLEERDYQALRSYSGVAPVTKSSGKRSGRRSTIVMRRACNPRLRHALYHWTRVSVQKDPYSKSLYTALRQRGHPHGRALRGVGDRLLRVLVSMLQHRTLYDPRRLGRQRLAQAEVTA
jgi:transposase